MKIYTQGNKIILCRYKITWTDENDTYEQFVPTQAEADSLAQIYGGTVETLDTSNDEWIDGIVLEPTKTPYDDALKIAQMGEQGYNDIVNAQKQTSIEQLRADLDFLSIMTGVEL